MKRLLKQAANQAAATVAPLVWSMRPPSLLVLMYHRVLPADHPDRSTEQPGMYVSPQTLEMHLRVLAEKFNFVQLDEWLQSVAQGTPVPRRACAVTFDDGWRDNYQYAFPILKRHSVPATIFLVSDLVGRQYAFWPNALARILSSCDAATLARMPDWLRRLAPVAPTNGGRVTLGELDRIINECKATRSDSEMLEAIGQLQAATVPEGGERDLMSWEEIRELQSSGLVVFGSHTRMHTRLSRVDSADVLRDEIVGSREEIAQRLGTVPRVFCYPNGDYSDQALAIVRSTYFGAVTTQRGWHYPQQDPCLIRRIGVHDDISNRPASFLARLSGWL